MRIRQKRAPHAAEMLRAHATIIIIIIIIIIIAWLLMRDCLRTDVRPLTAPPSFQPLKRRKRTAFCPIYRPILHVSHSHTHTHTGRRTAGPLL